MIDNPIKFELGDEIVIDKDNVDEWISILGKPLADAFKLMPESDPINLIVTSVNHHMRVVTIGRIVK